MPGTYEAIVELLVADQPDGGNIDVDPDVPDSVKQLIAKNCMRNRGRAIIDRLVSNGCESVSDEELAAAAIMLAMSDADGWGFPGKGGGSGI